MTDPIQIKHYKEDITSFNQLYKEFQRRFVRFANTYVRDLTTAEDITIEAMMYYWENRQSLSEDSNIPAYILTIIKNKCLNYLRHQQIHAGLTDKCGCSRHNRHNSLYSRQSRNRYNNRCPGRR